MGAVYLAREKALERLVAIKVLLPETSDDQARERFRREARTAANMTHPNIVPLFTFGEADGTMYFVMGYVRGESLSDRIRREGKMSSEDTRRILSELAYALDYAHSQGCSVVRDFVGHGIGAQFHEAPQIPHFGKRGRGLRLKAGMTFTIEPMINLGDWHLHTLDDGWTAVTDDGKRSAQFEHTILVTDSEPEILTAFAAPLIYSEVFPDN